MRDPGIGGVGAHRVRLHSAALREGMRRSPENLDKYPPPASPPALRSAGREQNSNNYQMQGSPAFLLHYFIIGEAAPCQTIVPYCSNTVDFSLLENGLEIHTGKPVIKEQLVGLVAWDDARKSQNNVTTSPNIWPAIHRKDWACVHLEVVGDPVTL
ncbi:hypothetical protein KUCAC02_028826 [Chaenocephalus aceratus]|uniref:Uncharacterized protein n=1 Tax=Chaenocephalus aceratus TaxID=36190 RepID=A0ACB9X3K5_CHAAC|nr:hypothetical protein KUCAC02_028826 [Chaenocephalus aceratus]